MRSKTGHIIFPKKMKYTELVPIYRELYMQILEDTEELEEEEERSYRLVRLYIMDLETNTKPEGHNRNCRTKLVFPIIDGNIQFYIKGNARSSEITKVTENISRFLNNKGIDHKVEWDKLRCSGNR